MPGIMVTGSSSPAPPTVPPLLGMFIMAIRGGGTISSMLAIMVTGSSSEDTMPPALATSTPQKAVEENINSQRWCDLRVQYSNWCKLLPLDAVKS